MSEALVPSVVSLPDVTSVTKPTLGELTAALGVPRGILASDQEISHAWQELPAILQRIPEDRRTELHVRMCVAVATGLFDSAINYAWNSSVIELRSKVRGFGLHVVPQLIGRPFDEAALLDLKDAQLLELCLSLNLITEDGYFFLDQCRDIRNNFSAAHPPMGALDDHEFLSFLNRCAKYAISATQNPQGVDTQAFITSLKGGRFGSDQKDEWVSRLSATHDAQRSLLIGTLYGIYCDPASTEPTRLNALDISLRFAGGMTPATKSDLINRHSDYIAEGKADRQAASQAFFERIGLLELLSQPEQHSLISAASQRLMSVHQAYDNFYNEPPFAHRLLELTGQVAVPDTTQPEYVETVVTCAAGNPWGVSVAAMPSYERMIRGFSPREISLMLDLPGRTNIISRRMSSSSSVRERYKYLVALLDADSVPTTSQSEYERWAT